jgi:hypothetical protein
MVGHQKISTLRWQLWKPSTRAWPASSGRYDADGILIVTSDHGNAEEWNTQLNEPHTAHTSNPAR